VLDPLLRAKIEYAIGAVVACMFILLGIFALANILFSALNSGPIWQSNVNLRYLIAGVGCVFLGVVLLLMTVPAFIPLKHRIWLAPEVCPRCGALVEEDAAVCTKCTQQLDPDSGDNSE